ncbi:glycosyltransferase family 39 protein [Chloroflexota bacterium]
MVAILLVATIFAWHELGAHEVLGRDENATITKLDQPDLLTVLQVTGIKVTGQPGNMQPFYFLSQYAAWPLVGRSAFMLRFLPSLFGLLAIALTYKLGEALWSREVGLVGALLTSVLPLHVSYSQIARPYTLLVVFSLASAFFLVQGLKTNRACFWVGYVLTAALGFYTHYNALMVLATEALSAGIVWLVAIPAVVRGQRSSKWLVRPALGFLSLAILCAPSFIRLVGLAGSEPSSQIALELTLLSLNSFMYTSGLTARWYRYLILGLMALGMAASLYARRWRPALLAALWLTVPALILGMIPSPRPFEERYLIFLPPVALLLAGLGVTSLARLLGRLGRFRGGTSLRWVALVALTAGLALVLVAPLRRQYALNRAANRIDQTLQVVKGHAGPGDIVIISPRFFVEPLNVEGATVLYLTEHLTPAEFDELVSEHGRTWVLYSSYLPPVELQEPLDRWLQTRPDQFVRVPIKSVSAVAYHNHALADPEARLQDRIVVLEDLAEVSEYKYEAWVRYGVLAEAYQSLSDFYHERGESALAAELQLKALEARQAAPQP